MIAHERYYGCKARHQNRNHCSVSRTVREDHLRAAMMSSLTKQLGTPRALRHLLATQQAAAAQTEDTTRRELTRTLAQADAGVTKLVDLAMNAGPRTPPDHNKKHRVLLRPGVQSWKVFPMMVAGARNTQRWLTLELPMEVRIAC